MYGIVQQQQTESEAGTFKSEALYDIVENLAIYQSTDKLKGLFDDFVSPVLNRAKKSVVAKGVEKIKKQQRKAYQLLQNILSSDQPGCVEFVNKNVRQVQDLVLSALKTTCNTTQAARLQYVLLFCF